MQIVLATFEIYYLEEAFVLFLTEQTVSLIKIMSRFAIKSSGSCHVPALISVSDNPACNG